jgi:hypothetical protein
MRRRERYAMLRLRADGQPFTFAPRQRRSVGLASRFAKMRYELKRRFGGQLPPQWLVEAHELALLVRLEELAARKSAIDRPATNKPMPVPSWQTEKR